MAHRKPVSAAVPAPGDGSRISRTAREVRRANAWTTRAVSSVDALSTTTRVKFRSVCWSSARNAPAIQSCSL
jgi:hypothetical protein